MQAAFVEVSRQLEANGLVVKKGTLIDATIVGAASRRPQLKAGSKPRLAREPGASFTRKGGRSYFGYRVHVGVDQGSGLIRRLAFTPAHVNESVVADALICGDEAAVYADKGYENKHRRRRLKRCGVKDRIMHRANKHQPRLPPWRERRNALIAKRRAPVEAVFGTLKRLHGRARVRFTNFAANLADLLRQATVYNLRRAAPQPCRPGDRRRAPKIRQRPPASGPRSPTPDPMTPKSSPPPQTDLLRRGLLRERWPARAPTPGE